MMKQRKIVEAELTGHVVKQCGKIAIIQAESGSRFELVDEAGVGQ